MRFIKEYIKWFITITTGVLLIFILNTTKYEYIRSIYLWEIFGVSAVTSLITTLFFSINPKKVISKSVQIIIVFLHYLSLFVTMLFFGHSFGWISLDVRGILNMALSVMGVYLCTALLSIITGMQDAKKMNEALNKFKD